MRRFCNFFTTMWSYRTVNVTPTSFQKQLVYRRGESHQIDPISRLPVVSNDNDTQIVEDCDTYIRLVKATCALTVCTK